MSEEYVSKRELDQRFAGSDRLHALLREADKDAINKALGAAEKAVIIADENVQRWQASANEWRSAMVDRERAFVPRGEFDAHVKQLNDRQGNLVDRVATIEGRFLGMAAIGIASGVAGFVYAVVAK